MVNKPDVVSALKGAYRLEGEVCSEQKSNRDSASHEQSGWWRGAQIDSRPQGGISPRLTQRLGALELEILGHIA